MLMDLVNVLVKLDHPSIVQYYESRVRELLDWQHISPGEQLFGSKSE